MPNLNDLTNEITNIKNDIVTCHSNLKNKLIDKGVEVTDEKLSGLIDKVDEIKGGGNILPEWCYSSSEDCLLYDPSTNTWVKYTL